MNREYRGIDRETDVLSFPNVDFELRSLFLRLLAASFPSKSS